MVPDVLFTPDPEVKIHERSAIQLICKPFQSHEQGLPEWIKNSSDAYARNDFSADDSVIIVLLQDGVGGNPAMVACLDFGGMSALDIENKFRIWADPTAAGKDEGVEGGHGNGGKCYMTQLFDRYSYIHTCLEGRGSRYGFKGVSPTPGYFPSPEKGRNVIVGDPRADLASIIKVFKIKFGDLPETARRLVESRKAFTIVVGVGAKNLARQKIPARHWIESLCGYQQMVRPLERNKIFVFHNGHSVRGADPLALEDIEPIPGAELPRIVKVPRELIDPDTLEVLPTGALDGESRLELRTSNTSMRYSLKARHTINGWTHAGKSTGFWEVTELSRAPYSAKIYGDLFLDALAEFRQSDRRNHSMAPLTRALKEWLTEQIDEYSAKFVKLDELKASKEEQDELSRQNQALNRWKNAFLQQEFGGSGDVTEDGTGGDGRGPLAVGEVAQITIWVSHSRAGQGVTFRPVVKFFDGEGKRVRAPRNRWNSTDPSIASVDEDLKTITTHKPGHTKLSVVCIESGVTSNEIEIEVVDIVKIELSPDLVNLHAGSRHPVRASVTCRDGTKHEGAYLIWTEDDSSIASVSSGGMVFGIAPGETLVTAADNSVEAANPTRLTVLDPKEKGHRGSGFPQILLSEIDDDPLNDGDVPPRFSNADPPVLQRAQDVDANIWWINMASPLARRYIDTAKGSGAKSKEWRVYLLERYIEVMVKIVLFYNYPESQQLTLETMLRRWEEEATAMQQRAIDSLSAFLDGGEIGEVR